MNSTTEYQVSWEVSRFSITVNCSARPITVEKLVKQISRQLQKADVSDVSISVSANEERSAAGEK